MFGSPSAYLLWSLLTCFVGCFTGLPTVITHDPFHMFSQFLAYLIIHLWKYDEFKCLCWHGGQRPGTFKRVMVYVRISSITFSGFL